MRALPREFTDSVPDWTRPAWAPPGEEELALCRRIRHDFLFPGGAEPFVGDIVRAFRLLRGVRRYVEIGTFDKGNLAWLSTFAAPDAVLVDVDIAPNPDWTQRLQRVMPPTQRLCTVVSDSGSPETLERVVAGLDGQPADAVFIDGNHTAFYHLSDYAMYSRLVRPGGLVFMHDVYWDGDATTRGSRFATAEIDRLSPVYVVSAIDEPVHRFLPPFHAEPLWGCVGMVKVPPAR